MGGIFQLFVLVDKQKKLYKFTNSYVRSSLDPPFQRWERNKKVIFSYGRNVCKIEKIEIKVSIEREGTIVNKIKSNLKENVIV